MGNRHELEKKHQFHNETEPKKWAGVKSCVGNFPNQYDAFSAGNFPKKIRELPFSEAEVAGF